MIDKASQVCKTCLKHYMFSNVSIIRKQQVSTKRFYDSFIKQIAVRYSSSMENPENAQMLTSSRSQFNKPAQLFLTSVSK